MHSRSYIFAPQNRDCQESCVHLTDGIDMFVTGQRVIFLDTQVCHSGGIETAGLTKSY